MHAIAPGPVGGLESVVRALAIGQHRQGIRVQVCSVVAPGGDPLRLHEQLEDAGVTVLPVEIQGRAYLRELNAIRALLARHRPEVVHTHGYRSDLIAGHAGRHTGRVIVSTVHGFTGGDWKNRMYERLQCRALRRFDAVVAVSRPLVGTLEASGVPSGSIRCIPNAWGDVTVLPREEARRILGLPQDEVVIGWVGRLSREKGADVLIEALPHLAGPPVSISVLGTGPELERLRARATSLNLPHRVRWHGVVPDAGPLFSAFDIFVLSSRTEGTPVVLFESMAAGVPIVATRVGGVPDVLPRGEGLLVPPDDPRALASALTALHAEPERRRDLADAARARLRDAYGMPGWLNGYSVLYSTLLSPR
jgi:glycosyltransferase involved in cell wall biosynthesis